MSITEALFVHYARHFPISKGKLRVVDALWRRIAGKDHFRTAKLIYSDFRMNCQIDEMIQRQIYFFGTYFASRQTIAAWQMNAADANIVLDVGANVGIFSLAALAANPNATVHALEPTPHIARHLRDTVQINRLEARLHVHQIALSGGCGWSHLVSCNGGKDNGGMNYLSTAPEENGRSQPVETITLDMFVEKERISQIDLMKIDIQGHEAAALRGATACLESKKIRSVLIELNWSADPRSCIATECIQILSKHGFLFQDPLTLDEPKLPGPWMRKLGDVLAIAT